MSLRAGDPKTFGLHLDVNHWFVHGYWYSRVGDAVAESWPTLNGLAVSQFSNVDALFPIEVFVTPWFGGSTSHAFGEDGFPTTQVASSASRPAPGPRACPSSCSRSAGSRGTRPTRVVGRVVDEALPDERRPREGIDVHGDRERLAHVDQLGPPRGRTPLRGVGTATSDAVCGPVKPRIAIALA